MEIDLQTENGCSPHLLSQKKEPFPIKDRTKLIRWTHLARYVELSTTNIGSVVFMVVIRLNSLKNVPRERAYIASSASTGRVYNTAAGPTLAPFWCGYRIFWTTGTRTGMFRRRVDVS